MMESVEYQAQQNEIKDRLRTRSRDWDAPIVKRAVLDHGYVAFIEPWGSDRRIIEAARMSSAKGFLGWDPGPCPACNADGLSAPEVIDPNCYACEGTGKITGDQKLLSFLYTAKPQHATPFEMAGMIIEVQAPIFVFREWHRHRTQSYNEMSARYTALPDFNYVPDQDRLLVNAGGTNKQANRQKNAPPLTPDMAIQWARKLEQMYRAQEEFYQYGLSIGVPKELARVDLPVGRYSRMRASANLRNWMAFLTLRNQKGAQWEIRMYAGIVADLIRENFPRTYDLFAAAA
jgi:thymidylate synthase (FAD)